MDSAFFIGFALFCVTLIIFLIFLYLSITNLTSIKKIQKRISTAKSLEERLDEIPKNIMSLLQSQIPKDSQNEILLWIGLPSSSSYLHIENVLRHVYSLIAIIPLILEIIFFPKSFSFYIGAVIYMILSGCIFKVWKNITRKKNVIYAISNLRIFITGTKTISHWKISTISSLEIFSKNDNQILKMKLYDDIQRPKFSFLKNAELIAELIQNLRYLEINQPNDLIHKKYPEFIGEIEMDDVDTSDPESKSLLSTMPNQIFIENPKFKFPFNSLNQNNQNNQKHLKLKIPKRKKQKNFEEKEEKSKSNEIKNEFEDELNGKFTDSDN
ncbi:hypothetical protein M0811_03274 [Anaeramoeba ignava]|uniref:Transmembrane protein n=1 Tax=Anaeramoeba ignava TaxID=1746090 RepID=A0A9Q0L7P6_ANAIG|nr:hypothetical protein M0811_03274 [Anaeramoeba ignava]